MFQVLAFIKYWLLQADEHSLHSPFVFDLYNQVIKSAAAKEETEIEKLRQKLLTDPSEIEIQDFGAGSRVNSNAQRPVSEIAKNSSTPTKFSALLQALIEYFQHQTVLELGTSLGLNTLYLSQNKNTQITTFEGDPTLAHKAREHFHQFERKNIKLIEGNLDETLENSLASIDQIDLAYIDANHRYKPTLRYYETLMTKCHEKSLIVLDDIHWSKEMYQAWNEIKNQPEVIISIDLFEGGLLFFDPKLTKGDYILKF